LECKKVIQTVLYADEEITAQKVRHVKYWTSQITVHVNRHEKMWKKYSEIKTQRDWKTNKQEEVCLRNKLSHTNKTQTQ
jgi:hypothetical protein